MADRAGSEKCPRTPASADNASVVRKMSPRVAVVPVSALKLGDEYVPSSCERWMPPLTYAVHAGAKSYSARAIPTVSSSVLCVQGWAKLLAADGTVGT
jgi:hypothetical protein